MKLKMNFKYLLLCVVMFSVPAYSKNIEAKAVNETLHAETWDVPRHGEVLLNVPELAIIIKQWMLHPQKKIELRYPGGEAGELWVEELKDWLVSLGINSESIQITPGSGAEDIINLVLIKDGKNNE